MIANDLQVTSEKEIIVVYNSGPGIQLLKLKEKKKDLISYSHRISNVL
jgi:hypothetical protein